MLLSLYRNATRLRFLKIYRIIIIFYTSEYRVGKIRYERLEKFSFEKNLEKKLFSTVIPCMEGKARKGDGVVNGGERRGR